VYDLAIKNGKVYTDAGWIGANIYVADGKIAHFGTETYEAREDYDAQGLEVLPGLIDPHVHFDLDLGWIRSRDDFISGSVAAAYGGVTSVIDFLAPTHNERELEQSFHQRRREAEDCLTDYNFHATICRPDGDLEKYVMKMKELGMHTLKLFTTYSDSGRDTSHEHIIELLKLSEKHRFLLMAHIENDAMIKTGTSYRHTDLPQCRPTESETSEALTLASYVERYGGYLYMVHLSSGATLKELVTRYPHLLNQRFFVESCPQYFLFSSDDLNREDSRLYTCAPPLRRLDEQRLLHEYEHFVDTIGTDHCAFDRADKEKKRLIDMPLGIGGIEHSFTTMRRIYGDGVIPRMSSRVAALMGLPHKGKIEVGYDADLALFARDGEYVIDAHHGKTDYSLYRGLKGSGHFMATIVRGRFVLKHGEIMKHHGQWIRGEEPR